MTIADKLSNLVGIDTNQVNFIFCQLAAMICGCILRKYLPPSSYQSKYRHLFELIVGVILLYLCYGLNIIHLFLQAFPAYLMLVFLPLSFAQYSVLVFSLVYLSALHAYQIMTNNSSPVDISAPLMVQTQKLSSLIFHINDGMRINSGLPVIREVHKLNAIACRPRLLQMGGYLFCFHNSMVGPSMFYADYVRFIEGREADRLLDTDLKERFNRDKDEIRMARSELYKQLKLLVIHTLLTIWALSNFKPERLVDDEFTRKTFWQKVIYLSIAGFAFRQTFYFAWTISCIANLCAGFGFSGFDADGKPEYRFATNINFIGFELGTSFKSILDAWNMATTRWLRDCVYDRVPKPFAVWAVFLASAIWHGFHPGYYLTFISGAMVTVSGRVCRRYLRPYFLGSSTMHFIYDIMTHISGMFCINYLAGCFLLKNFGKVMHFWKQMRFIGHIGPLAMIICLPLVCGKPRNRIKFDSGVDQTSLQVTKLGVLNGPIAGTRPENRKHKTQAADKLHNN